MTSHAFLNRISLAGITVALLSLAMPLCAQEAGSGGKEGQVNSDIFYIFAWFINCTLGDLFNGR